MQKTDNVRPIIIKRKKVIAGGRHHGGAWKVAYADFVTAMMAFFLMLWLLGAADADQRQGIADYFAPTFSFQSRSSGGDGVMGGSAISEDASLADSIASRAQLESEQTLLEELAESFQAISGQSPLQEQALQHVNILLTDEGLVVEVFDLPDSQLFDPRSARPNPVLLVVLDMLSDVFSMVTNPVAINAHSAAFPSVVLENPVWELTLDRAQSVRAALTESGFSPARMHRVTGHADRSLALATNPMDLRNNRLEITLLRTMRR
ncbi:flagellar motor protein MotB [Roseinatronobacter alkalisoli]|uniref:Flagellar motor protein MotB n=1 Tax=Roseinatronobacter alkalisoli TaxID=3028235 RepID=A0ABT5T504_9RHOB|nr:flagellar motor protein MotB [Roseinatronobacter sp. HJB301]MDD7970199.1 flagellar motor protein MotB [Roseinatronobacter sp. HJB301]